MEAPVEKNKEYIVDVIDSGCNGEGIAKIGDFVIFIENAIKGEKVKILIVKVLSSYAFGKIVEILQKSQHRTKVDCPIYRRCGGCNLQHVDYKETLNIKKNTVKTLIDKNLKNKVEVKETLGMENPYNYRNKLMCPVGLDKSGRAVIGPYAKRTHDIIPMVDCMIQNKKALEILKYIEEIINKYNISVYDENTNTGLMRSVVIKTGFATNSIMVVLVINSDSLPYEKEIKEDLIKLCSDISTIVININKKKTNVMLGEKNKTLFGPGYITDKLGKFSFNISANSFYQVNPVQAEKLYNIALENLNITKNDIVFDLYCGIGTISIFAAQYAKKVYGIEIVEQAIKNAKENAINNKVENIEFITGNTETTFANLLDNGISPDIIIVDPPRRGLDNITIKNIIKNKPKCVGYISCNPATLVRDLSILNDFFEIKFIQPVDMFPWTTHIECVAILQRL